MTRQDYPEFFERLGHRVVRTCSADWYNARTGLFLSLPHSMTVDPEPPELREVLGRGHGWGVRYPSPVNGPGRPSYALVATGADYGLDRLTANNRSKVRRGLKRWEVRRLDTAYARAHGERANHDTLARLSVHDPYRWARWWDAVAATPDMETWGALLGDTLGAYLVAAIVEDGAELLVARSRDDARGDYPNNALVFTAARDLLTRPGVRRVFFGLESLERAGGVDRFKEGLGFVPEPIHQRVVFHPLAERLLRSSAVGRVVRTAARQWPHRESLRKLEGLLVFNGSRPDTRIRR